VLAPRPCCPKRFKLTVYSPTTPGAGEREVDGGCPRVGAPRPSLQMSTSALHAASDEHICSAGETVLAIVYLSPPRAQDAARPAESELRCRLTWLPMPGLQARMSATTMPAIPPRRREGSGRRCPCTGRLVVEPARRFASTAIAYGLATWRRARGDREPNESRTASVNRETLALRSVDSAGSVDGEWLPHIS